MVINHLRVHGMILRGPGQTKTFPRNVAMWRQVFECDAPDSGSEKFMCTFPYPYMCLGFCGRCFFFLGKVFDGRNRVFATLYMGEVVKFLRVLGAVNFFSSNEAMGGNVHSRWFGIFRLEEPHLGSV